MKRSAAILLAITLSASAQQEIGEGWTLSEEVNALTDARVVQLAKPSNDDASATLYLLCNGSQPIVFVDLGFQGFSGTGWTGVNVRIDSADPERQLWNITSDLSGLTPADGVEELLFKIVSAGRLVVGIDSLIYVWDLSGLTQARQHIEACVPDVLVPRLPTGWNLEEDINLAGGSRTAKVSTFGFHGELVFTCAQSGQVSLNITRRNESFGEAGPIDVTFQLGDGPWETWSWEVQSDLHTIAPLTDTSDLVLSLISADHPARLTMNVSDKDDTWFLNNIADAYEVLLDRCRSID